MSIGILALQGAFREQSEAVLRCGFKTKEVRKPEDLEDIQGLIVPGGESTTIGKLLTDYKLCKPLIKKIKEGMPVFGICAGMVILAEEIAGQDKAWLGLMKIKVVRNAYGRQIESFETDIEIPALGKPPFHAVFIRAPQVEKIGKNVEVMAVFQGRPVMVRQDNLLATSFHPEITKDDRIHRFFLDMVKNFK